MNINTIKTDLMNRGFIDNGNGKMEFASGSIANYTKCTVCLSYRLWGDIAEDWFYLVRYECFRESGQPEVDCHIITEHYLTAEQMPEFLKSKGILTRAEADARRAELRARIARRGRG